MYSDEEIRRVARHNSVSFEFLKRIIADEEAWLRQQQQALHQKPAKVEPQPDERSHLDLQSRHRADS